MEDNCPSILSILVSTVIPDVTVTESSVGRVTGVKDLLGVVLPGGSN